MRRPRAISPTVSHIQKGDNSRGRLIGPPRASNRKPWHVSKGEPPKRKFDPLGRRGSPSFKKPGNQDDSTQEAWGAFTSEPPQVACAARSFSMNKAGRARDLNRRTPGRRSVTHPCCRDNVLATRAI